LSNPKNSDILKGTVYAFFRFTRRKFGVPHSKEHTSFFEELANSGGIFSLQALHFAIYIAITRLQGIS